MAAVKEKAALRELARLHDDSFLGSNAQSKKASVDPTLPQRLRTLFHGEGGALEEAGCGGGRRLVPVYCDPPIYVVPNFLTARELDHFDDLLTRRRAAFKQSHTDGDGERLISKERTSISLALPKSGDAVLRAIEARAAELVGLPSDHVEPLQIVHYSRGARFDMHHDLAPIRIRALLFCNVDASGAPDVRLCHRACPVPDGHIKFGVNVWLSDVSQQAHVLEAAPMSKGAQRSGAQHGKGILAPLLFTDPDDLPPPPAAALLGVAFRKAFGRQGTFVGTVVAHDSAFGYHLEYEDGDEEDVGLDELVRLPLASPDALVGRRVSKHFAGHGRFEGRVAAYEGARGFELHYEDGDLEHVDAAELLRLLLPALKPRKRKRAGSSAEPAE